MNKMKLLGKYTNIIDVHIDEPIFEKKLVILKDSDGIVYSVQEVNKHYSEKGNVHYFLFHCLYGKNALNFTPWDFDQIREQIEIERSDIIIDDFRPRKAKIDNIDLFIVIKDFYNNPD